MELWVGKLQCDVQERQTDATSFEEAVDVVQAQQQLSERKRLLKGAAEVDPQLVDPYVALQLGDQKFRTASSAGVTHFEWGEVFRMEHTSTEQELEIMVHHMDRSQRAFVPLGELRLNLEALVCGSHQDGWWPLVTDDPTIDARLYLCLYSSTFGATPTHPSNAFVDFTTSHPDIKPLDQLLDADKSMNPMTIGAPLGVPMAEGGDHPPRIAAIVPEMSNHFPAMRFILRRRDCLPGQEGLPPADPGVPSVAVGLVPEGYSHDQHLADQGWACSISKGHFQVKGEVVGIMGHHHTFASPPEDKEVIVVEVTPTRNLVITRNGTRLLFDYRRSWLDGAKPVPTKEKLFFAFEVLSPMYLVELDWPFIAAQARKFAPAPPSRNLMVYDVSGSLMSEPQLRNMFVKYDTDKTGFMNKTEFAQLYKDQEEYFGVYNSEQRVHQVLSRHNVFDDNRMNFNEFVVVMMQLARR